VADILLIDDQTRTLELCRRVMPEHEWHGPARSWRDTEALLEALKSRLDLVLLDVHFDIPESDLLGLPAHPQEKDVRRARRRQGIEILQALRKAQPELPVVLMTSRGEIGLERAADRHDIEEYTYFLDDDEVDGGSLRGQVEGILQARRGTERDGAVYWGRSLTMRRIRQRLLILARGRLPVILEGETGTGKSLVARDFLHARSGRKGAFVSVDLSTMPRDLVAAHLFGSLRGAYTGSVSDRKGAFEEADGGTLFLDEIGNMPEDVQKMLLTVLQEGAVTRLGDTKARKVDVKLVVATNEELRELVRERRFRADLYMRLNPGCTVVLPPLKDRKMDFQKLLGFAVERSLQSPHIQELVEEYAKNLAAPSPRVSLVTSAVPVTAPGTLFLLLPSRTLALMRNHEWPGNLREFAMTVDNLLTISLAEAIGTHLAGRGRPDVIQLRPKTVRDLLRAVRLETPGDDSGWSIQLQVRPHDGLNKVAQDIERQYFKKLYFQERGDFAAMARVLLGDADGARKVQLRFNQLGLKVRELKEAVA
jgi:DNA-binding NtrC family response regulator